MEIWDILVLVMMSNLDNVSRFNESSNLMGWLRDYLRLNSSQIINGYTNNQISTCITSLALIIISDRQMDHSMLSTQ